MEAGTSFSFSLSVANCTIKYDLEYLIDYISSDLQSPASRKEKFSNPFEKNVIWCANIILVPNKNKY